MTATSSFPAPSASATPVAAPLAPATSTKHNGWTAADFLAMMTATAATLPGYTIGEATVTPYPFRDAATKRDILGVALSIPVVKLATATTAPPTPERHHTVVIAVAGSVVGSERFYAWCGDQFMSKGAKPALLGARLQGAVKDLPLSRQPEITNLLRASIGIYPPSDPCSFWVKHATEPNAGGCRHTKAAFASVLAEGGVAVLEHLQNEFRTLMTTAHALADGTGTPIASVPASLKDLEPAATAATATHANTREARRKAAYDHFVKDPTLQQILKFSYSLTTRAKGVTVAHSMRRRKPVMVLGPAGTGKSHGFREMGQSELFDSWHEFPISPGMDALSFLGGPTVKSVIRPGAPADRLYLHQDSVLIQAMREAANGKKVALHLAELGNVTNREVLNIIKTILDPDGHDYLIPTGLAHERADGSATTEVLRVPVENISVWASTNVGSDYNARGVGNDADQAVFNRFHRVYIQPTVEQTIAIMEKEAARMGYDKIITKMMGSWVKNMDKMATDNEIKRGPNLRDINDILNIAERGEEIPEVIVASANRWTELNENEYPIDEQLKVVQQAVVASFPGIYKA
jgi:hypothetical protein